MSADLDDLIIHK